MSLIPDTYDGLVSAIKALAEDDSVEFAAYIPVAIHLAEERLVKEIDTEGLHFTDTISTSAGDPVLTKPTGYRLGYDLSFTTSGGIQMMEKRTDDFLKDYWPVTTSVGIPKYYADKSNTEFMVAPAPASAYDFELNYTGNVSSLSNSVQSNYYTEFASDALFYGTMSNMSEFMKDYQIQSVWESKYDRAMQGINNQGRRGRREDGTAPSNPTPSLNTLRGDN